MRIDAYNQIAQLYGVSRNNKDSKDTKRVEDV